MRKLYDSSRGGKRCLKRLLSYTIPFPFPVMDTLIILASASRPTCLETQIKVLYIVVLFDSSLTRNVSFDIEHLFYPMSAMARFTESPFACIWKASIDLVARRSQDSLQEHLYRHQCTQVSIYWI